jgi:hypothetical protein
MPSRGVSGPLNASQFEIRQKFISSA